MAFWLMGSFALPSAEAASPWAEIQVVDSTTGRGEPLVELETVNGLIFVTDNFGRVAFHEPGLMDHGVYFLIRSHGYEAKKDGFGYAGATITPRAGQKTLIQVKRRAIAERLCRLTGEGLDRDSTLLGHASPVRESLHPGKVAGQDSVQAVVYRDKVYWIWGDTLRINYPLGLFRVAGATTPTFDPDNLKSNPADGIPFDYFVDSKTGFVRATMPLAQRPEGVIWIFSLAVVPNEQGHDSLIGRYSRRKGLHGELEQGIAVFNDDKAVFEPAKELPLDETWRRPDGHPIVVEERGVKWLYFGSPTPNVRVPATLKAVLDRDQYEAFTCVKAGTSGKSLELDMGTDGVPRWRWQKELPPVDSKTERRWIRDGKLKQPAHARFCPANAAASSERIELHSGSVRWNAYRQRWILIAGQIGGKASFLGEVWYAEAKHPTGPFAKAVRVATHDRQSFYNVCHHSFLDRDDGRTIHFEGTYTNEFSGNPVKTPRYNYNQILYRLDLDAAALRPARVE